MSFSWNSVKSKMSSLSLRRPATKWHLLVVAGWIVAVILALAIPSGTYTAGKTKYYNAYGRYVEYENQQRQYEQNQNNNNNNNNYNGNYNNNNNNNNNNYYGVTMDCSWYDYQCRKQRHYYRMSQDGGRDGQVYTPDWYTFINGMEGDGEEDRRYYEEMGLSYDADAPQGPLQFVHVWTLLMFLGMAVYGGVVLYTGTGLVGLIVVLTIFAQFALLQLLLCGQGVIKTDGRQMEDSVYGWNGQLGVLMVYTNFAYTIFGFGFALVLGLVLVVEKFTGRTLLTAPVVAAANDEDGIEDTEAGKNANYTAPGVYKTMD